MDSVTSCAHEGGGVLVVKLSVLIFRTFAYAPYWDLQFSVTWQVKNESQGLASRKAVWRTTPDLKSCLHSLQGPPSGFHIYN